MIDYENDLNESQYEAVTHYEGPLLVLAGAGSGKTRVITYRIAHLIDRYKADPSSILAMTFTNKAADEMKKRVSLLLQRDSGVFISTFHSACAFFLRRYATLLGYSRNYVIYDDDDSRKIIREILEIHSQDNSADNVYRYYNEISSRKDNGQDIMSLQDDSADSTIMKAYQKKLFKSNAMDFSDLLLNMVKILKISDEVADTLSDRFRFILVDEFQDTNRIQMELLLLFLKKHRNICVVGDDDQSIYRWRGATIENILRFDSNFSDAKIVKLEQNYRSTGAIISAASELIRNNEKRHSKKLFTKNPMGENITFFTAENDVEEASFIASEIERLKTERRKNYGDFSILVRTNAQMRILEEKLRLSKIPYEVIGGVKFYERKEIKDIISYLRIISNPEGDADFERILNVPPRGFGDVTLSRLREISQKENISLFRSALAFQKTKNFAEFLSDMMKESEKISVRDLAEKVIDSINYRAYLEQYYKNDYLDRIENIEEFLDSMSPRDESEPLLLSQFLESISLMSDIDKASLSSGTVSLMTIHSAKGLEFPVVFIAGFEENLIPHYRSVLDEDELAEERRLLYVAITRAKEKLFLSYAKERFQAGLPLSRRRSRFFEELPVALFTFLPVKALNRDTLFDHKQRREESEYRVEYYPEFLKNTSKENESPFRVGMSVSHSKFGVGVIRQIEGSGDEMKLLIFFERFGYKKLLPSYVKIL
ncbi:MAG: UvrD-helicase domain-containing protein [Deltaproteobacteria bacterium]|nr:UvrD-helicase domain-containing protein [Deltaproteobacteria bacterium]